MLAQAHRHHRGRGVSVIGRRDDHRVDLRVELVQQLAKVVVLLGFLLLPGHLVQTFLVDVAHRDDPAHPCGVLGVALPLPPTPMQAMFRVSFGPTPHARLLLPWTKTPKPATEAPNKNDRRFVVMFISDAPVDQARWGPTAAQRMEEDFNSIRWQNQDMPSIVAESAGQLRAGSETRSIDGLRSITL